MNSSSHQKYKKYEEYGEGVSCHRIPFLMRYKVNVS